MSALRRWRLPALDRGRLVALLCLLVALFLTVPLGAAAPTQGLDESWRLALNTFGDLRFGRDIVFTYGPWGRLDWPMITERGAYALGLAVRTGVLVSLWVLSVRGLRQWWPLWAAAPLASLFVVLVSPSDVSTMAIAAMAQYVLWCALGADRPSPRSGLVRVVVLAALTALVLQVKFSNGLAAGALTALAVPVSVELSRRRQLVAWVCTAASFVVATCVAWLAAGQDLVDLGPWVRGSLELTSGYAEAMGIEVMGHAALGYTAGVLLGLAAVAATVLRLQGRSRTEGIVALLAVAVIGGFAFKSAFIRHDDFHQGLYFIVLSAVFVALTGSGRAVAWLTTVGTLVSLTMAANTIAEAPGLPTAAARWSQDVTTMASHDRQVEVLDTARAAMAASHQVPAVILDGLRDDPVSIDPYETSVAWTYRLGWSPVPVFQLYAAYTPDLDRLNATALGEAPAGQHVLRHTYAYTDGRNPLWDSPLYQLELMCNYRVAAAEPSWTLIAKGPARCGDPESLGTESVAAGSSTELPRSSGRDLLLARFTPDPPNLLVRLGQALVKPLTPMTVDADGSIYRLSRKTSPSGILVTIPAVEAGAHAPLDVRSLSFSEPGTLELVRIPIS